MMKYNFTKYLDLLPENIDEPIIIKLTGNDFLDKDAILNANRERDLKLANLTINYYNAEIEKPEQFIGLYNPLVLKLLEDHFKGLNYKLIKVSGRKKEKTPEYYLGLGLAYEGSNFQSVNKISKTEFARNFAEHCIRRQKGKSLSIRDKKDIHRLQAQIQNDLSQISDPSIASLIQAILKAIIIDGLSAAEAAQTIDFTSIS